MVLLQVKLFSMSLYLSINCFNVQIQLKIFIYLRLSVLPPCGLSRTTIYHSLRTAGIDTHHNNVPYRTMTRLVKSIIAVVSGGIDDCIGILSSF